MYEFVNSERMRLRQALYSHALQAYTEPLEERMQQGWQQVFAHGDWPRWLQALQHLPTDAGENYDIARDCIRVGPNRDDAQQRQWLMQLHPWRKGPFRFFGTMIDTEWRSDWKWQRLQPFLPDLSGQVVLDIGCGSGYHLWRMAAAGATAIGIDPTALFAAQFALFKRCMTEQPVFYIPVGIEAMPPTTQAFDTVFSMGILYHRRAPIDHLLQLHGLLRKQGTLVLETLVIDGDAGQCLLPPGRYAKMRNVWFIPSIPMLTVWLQRAGFRDIHCVNVCATDTKEQRSTDWMTFESLADFLDSDDPQRTIEGHPAPKRAMVLARR